MLCVLFFASDVLAVLKEGVVTAASALAHIHHILSASPPTIFFSI
jgi:hypothetical protein